MGKFNVADYFNPANPSIPSTYEKTFSEFETLGKLITYVNTLYDQFVTLTNDETTLTNNYNILISRINEYKTQLDSFIKGYTIPDGTITLKQLSFDIMEQLQEWVREYMYDMHNFVSFGIENDYFVAYIPTTWKDITFSTDLDGRLVLTF